MKEVQEVEDGKRTTSCREGAWVRLRTHCEYGERMTRREENVRDAKTLYGRVRVVREVKW